MSRRNLYPVVVKWITSIVETSAIDKYRFYLAHIRVGQSLDMITGETKTFYTLYGTYKYYMFKCNQMNYDTILEAQEAFENEIKSRNRKIKINKILKSLT